MATSMTTRRVHVHVSGRVQGVFFRDATRREAQRLGVSGWVRNLPDGRVEGEFQGPPDAVDALVAWCRQGPPDAKVEDVELTIEEPGPDEDGFRVRR
jgi:acylphosphatase